MATGQLQSGGVFSWPDVPELGYETWAEMTGMHPAHPLVGGQSGQPGYGSISTRQVAVANPAVTVGPASGSPASAHWKEVFNLKGNPIGWVLIAAVLYLGLMHIHVRAGASGGLGFGKGR
jgi:hypothetical protein